MTKVVCLICGREFKWITGLHLKTHGITYSEYLEKFPYAETGIKTWNTGKTKETDDRVKKYGEALSIIRKEFFETDEGIKAREKLREDHLGMKALEDTKKKMSDSHLKFNQTKEGIKLREQKSKNMEGKNNTMNDPIVRKNHSDAMSSVEFRQKRSEYMLSDKNPMKDPNVVEKVKGEGNHFYGKHHTEESLRKILKVVCAAPNKPEQHLEWLLNDIFPNEYKFVGDGSVIIGGYSPDFININGQKKLIELFGDYWHKGDDEGNRIFLFKLLGFNTLIVWEHELRDDEIEMTIAKIIEFHNR